MVQFFRLERNGQLEAESYGNANGPCSEWQKDPEHCKVAEVDAEGRIVRYLDVSECRSIAQILRTASDRYECPYCGVQISAEAVTGRSSVNCSNCGKKAYVSPDNRGRLQKEEPSQ